MLGKKGYLYIFLILTSIVLLTYFVVPPDFEKNTVASLSDISFYQKIFSPEENSKPISLLFVGDIMLDRSIRKDGELYGYENIFACLEEEFKKHDEVIGNLEGTITSNKSVSRDAEYLSPESYRFTFDKKSVEKLRNIGLSIVSIGNNHIRDFGNDGITQTIQSGSEINLDIFGDPRTSSQRYIIKNIEGNRVAFIVYNQFFGTVNQTLEDLEVAKKTSDIQIIFTHWGDEYLPVREDIKTLAHNFVDKGADLIIGTHPHVIQENEKYKDIEIFYSLGNFIFDQYWEEAVRNGLLVTVLIEDKKIISTQKIFSESIRHKGTCLKTPPTP